MTLPSTDTLPKSARGQATVIGYVLLISVVVFSGIGIAYFGSTAISELRGAANTQTAEFAMRESDARLSQVAFSTNDAHTLDYSKIRGVTSVTEDGSMEITIRNDSHVCTGDLSFGTIQTEANDGDTVAYQAGGVWKMSKSGAVMLSPPNMQYTNGTFSFQLVNVSGKADGQINKLQVTKDSAQSKTKTQSFQGVFTDPQCNPPDNATITIQSDYYTAWGRFFETHFDDGTVTVNDSEETASILLETAGSSAYINQANNTVTSDEALTATVEVLGTELSGTSGGNKINGPTTFRISINGSSKTPWYDSDLDDPIDPEEDDLNDPVKGEHFNYSFDRSTGVSISVYATSYTCNDYDETGVTNTYSGTTYTEERCDDVGNERIEISSTSNSGNLVILEDGDKVPDFSAAGPEQRNLTEILEERIDDSGYVQLDENEFVFLYELSKENADPDNADSSDDPDYNDAVVLLTITEKGSVSAPENFAIHVAVNEVVATPL
ncbi:hypothetical protein ACFQJC_10320 [Haloferax namakaokahaiae]|uniref:Flagellin n=1 Tax=Haloferax namakaokahaiae TaxID=1748331 RepID=A0ABD5ZF83_9EURY